MVDEIREPGPEAGSETTSGEAAPTPESAEQLLRRAVTDQNFLNRLNGTARRVFMTAVHLAPTGGRLDMDQLAAVSGLKRNSVVSARAPIVRAARDAGYPDEGFSLWPFDDDLRAFRGRRRSRPSGSRVRRSPATSEAPATPSARRPRFRTVELEEDAKLAIRLTRKFARFGPKRAHRILELIDVMLKEDEDPA